MKTNTKAFLNKARAYFELNARFMRDDVYSVRLGNSSRAIIAKDTESLWNKFLEGAKDRPEKLDVQL